MSNTVPFVPLYFKSEYSMLQSACKLSPSILLSKEYGFESLALTDINVMHGAFKFYNECKKNNIKPIIGLHIDYMHNERKSSLLVYAMNMFGYKNLMKLSSKLKISGKPLEYEYLESCSMGLMVVVPTFENIIGYFVKEGNVKEANLHLSLLQNTFSNIYLGVSLSTKEDRELIDRYVSFGSARQIELVEASPISYLHIDDLAVYQTLLSIGNGGQLVNMSERNETEYMHTFEELQMYYNRYPFILTNTVKVAQKCNIEINYSGYQLPKYDSEINASEYLKELCYKGLKKRIIQNNIKNINVYENRLLYELETIKEMGFSDYFLIVWDYVKYAKKNGIYVGPGRGSAAASLVSYSLGITDVNPIEYGLLFERFLNKERITMPDIDIDFPDDERDKVIEYVGKKYGENKVAHIATFGTFKVKLAIRDTARVLKTNENSLKQVIKVIDKYNSDGKKLSEIIEESDELLRLMNDYEDIDQLLSIAKKVEGLPRNTSTHAAGIIMTTHDLVNYTALDNCLDGIYQTQFEASDLEALGLLKMDFLGLRNLTTIDKCVKLIQKDIPTFVLPKVFNDKETFNMLASGDVDGVFQLESEGMRKTLMNLRVSKFDDINHALALYRPGPMDSIPTFIKRKFGEEKVEYYHPDLEPILKETYGMIVYQEQIMLIANKFAKYTLGEADVLRRAVSKKKKEVLEKERIKFVDSSVKAGYDKDVANNIYDNIVKFADYGFNKAHSVAYAQVAYITAFLKRHYFGYYLSVLMNGVIGSEADIVRYYQAARRKKINVVAPNINLSGAEFSVYNKSIVFPLSVIKGLGNVKTKAILEEREKGEFKDYQDFVLRTKSIIPYSLLENIIYSGALDIFGLSKKAMIDNYKTIIDREQFSFVKTLNIEYSNDEFTYGELLDKEKDTICINIKYNFFHQYEQLYRDKRLFRIEALKEGMYIRTLGMIKYIRTIKTKAGESMAFIKIEDDKDNIELTLFPKIYSSLSTLSIGQVIIVGGKVQKREQLQIVVDSIEKV